MPEGFQRGERQREFFDQPLGRVEFAGRHETARITAVQLIARLPEGCERVHKPCRTAPRARAAQNGALERCDRTGMRKSFGAEPQQRMFEQCQQLRRLKPTQRGFGDKACEGAGRRVGECIAARIIDLDLPAFERGHNAARESAVGCHQRRGLGGCLDGLAQTDRDR